MIDPETVARIIDAAQIVDVVGDFVSLRRRGVNYIGLCPFHDEKTGSFTVSPAKGIFKCFGCGKAGGPVHFIMEHEQLSYPDALRYLAKKYHIEIVEKELSPEQKQSQTDRESMFTLNIWAQKYFSKLLFENEQGRAIGLSYFRSRGFTDDTITKFGLGYCLDQYDTMCKSALKSGYDAQFIEKCGLGSKRDDGSWYDRFRGRVIFPVHTLSGKVVAFGGRVLKKSDKTAKYVNSPESEIYHKSNELYGIYFAKQNIIKQDCCYLVEGYTDVISMHQSGVTNVVASSGTSLTHGQIRLIHRFTSNITVLYDGDAAGIKASIRGIDLLLEEGMNIKVVLLPNGEDPDSYAQSHNASDFISYIEENQVDFIRFKINLLLNEIGNDPIKRAGLIADVVRSISLIPERITRSVYCKECSTLLDIDEAVIVAEMQKNLAKAHEEKLKQRTTNNVREPQGNGTQNHIHQNLPPENLPPYDFPSNEIPTPAEGIVRTSQQQEKNLTEQTLINHSEKYLYNNQELNILYYLVRNGSEILYENNEENIENEEAKYITANQFIIESLEDVKENNTIFKNPLYQQFIEIIDCEKPAIYTPKYFSNYPDVKISQLAAELLTDKYTISRLFTKYDDYIGDPNDQRAIAEYKQKQEIQRKENLSREIQTVIYEYKAAIIQHNERVIDNKIIEAQKNGDNDLIMNLIRQKQNIQILKKVVNQKIGGRVIICKR